MKIFTSQAVFFVASWVRQDFLLSCAFWPPQLLSAQTQRPSEQEPCVWGNHGCVSCFSPLSGPLGKGGQPFSCITWIRALRTQNYLLSLPGCLFTPFWCAGKRNGTPGWKTCVTCTCHSQKSMVPSPLPLVSCCATASPGDGARMGRTSVPWGQHALCASPVRGLPSGSR